MKKIHIAGLTALSLFSSLTGAYAQSATTDPVGYVTIDINGHNNEAANGITVPRISLVGSSEFASNTSAFASGANNVLTDSEGTFTAGDYINGSEVSHYVEITSGAHAGTISWISGSPGGTTLHTVDDLSLVASNSPYAIRKAFSISDIFGTIPAEISGGASQAAADEILILDASTGEYTSFWYKSSGLGGTGWRTTNQSISSPANYALFPTDGILILRKQALDTSIVVTGSVKLSDTLTDIEGSGYNLLSPLVPVEQLTPSNSGLYTTDSATGLAGSTSQSGADEILVYDVSSKSYTSFWFKSGGLGGTGWRSTDGSIGDPANYNFPAGSALFVYRKGSQPFTWTMPSVTVNN